MIGAFAYDFYKNRAEMTTDHLGVVAIGFVVSFITAMIVVKTFLTYVTRHGFTFLCVVAHHPRCARPDRAGAGALKFLHVVPAHACARRDP